MLTKRVGWAMLTISCALFIFVHALNNTIESRHQKLKDFSQKYTYELQTAKLSLAKNIRIWLQIPLL